MQRTIENGFELTGPIARGDWDTVERHLASLAPDERAAYRLRRRIERSVPGVYVVSTTGGPFSGTLCDTAARFETYRVGTTLEPTWISNSGGDTLVGVEITQSAVYVGGHQRWENNSTPPAGDQRGRRGHGHSSPSRASRAAHRSRLASSISRSTSTSIAASVDRSPSLSG
mgnify:CR=1 FL=1